MALKSLGYPLDHPVIKKGMEGIGVIYHRRQGDAAPATVGFTYLGTPRGQCWRFRVPVCPAAIPQLQKVRNGYWRRKFAAMEIGELKIPGTESGCWLLSSIMIFYPDMG